MSHEAALYDPANIVEVRSQFETCRYVALKGLMAPGLTAILHRHVQARAAAGNLKQSETEGVERALEAPSDTLMENILLSLTPRLEEITGLALYPTYSFVRLYHTGDKLHSHRDRYSCEVSVSGVNRQRCKQTPALRWRGRRNSSCCARADVLFS